MRIAFRVDASAQIGTGHLYRCLALADALRSCGTDVVFVIRDLGFDACALITSHGPYTVHQLSAPTVGISISPSPVKHADWASIDAECDATETVRALVAHSCDWIVVDHYAFDARWHSLVRKLLGCHIAVIDDLADRSIDADLVVDHNVDPDHEAKYSSCLMKATRVLGGPQFALLRASYAKAPRWAEQTSSRSIGIFVGGADPLNQSVLVWHACRHILNFDGHIEIVTTTANPHLETLKEELKDDPKSLISVNLPNLATFFSRHRLQIGAGGGAIWERCCIGAPTVAVIAGVNQTLSVPVLNEMGVLKMAGILDRWEFTTAGEIAAAVSNLLDSKTLRQDLSTASRHLVDGLGARRVAEAIMQEGIE